MATIRVLGNITRIRGALIFVEGIEAAAPNPEARAE
jgi:hypothetical protein